MSYTDSLAGIMHRFSTAVPQSSALTVLHFLALLEVVHGKPADCFVARLVSPAFAPLRHKNVCIIRARTLCRLWRGLYIDSTQTA